MAEQTDHNSKKNLTLVTGGARSGKSELAESMASECKLDIYYLATMQRWQDDPESVARIEKHRRRRPPNWKTIESPTGVDAAVLALPPGPAFVIIDCLSLYVSNLMLEGCACDADPYSLEDSVAGSIERVLSAISTRADLSFVTVSNEVGWGIVPDNALGRAYRDFLGAANQAFAGQASTVLLMVSGLPVKVK